MAVRIAIGCRSIRNVTLLKKQTCQTGLYATEEPLWFPIEPFNGISIGPITIHLHIQSVLRHYTYPEIHHVLVTLLERSTLNTVGTWGWAAQGGVSLL